MKLSRRAARRRRTSGAAGLPAPAITGPGSAVLVNPSRREECTLSDPGRLGRKTPCPRSCGGRESYGPGRGRSGYFNPVPGLAPGLPVFRSKLLWRLDLIYLAP